MPQTPLPDRLEFAILQIVMSFGGKRQNSWGEWANAVRQLVPEFADGRELKAAFTRLSKHGHLRLTKWNVHEMRDAEYSGNEKDDAGFFFGGDFGAEITDEGRSHWGKLNVPRRNRVFISHITEEYPVAQVLQKYISLAFRDNVPVFVSSDGKSIGGGKKWYNHIIENLRLSEIVLVLASLESKGREWINFEAGFGEGAEGLVIPVAIKNMSLGQLSYPLAGLQGRSADEIGLLVEDIGNRLGIASDTIDIGAYMTDLEDAEAQLIYKSLSIEPVVEAERLCFSLQNVGNIDLELLMLEVSVPKALIPSSSAFDSSRVRTDWASRNGTEYRVLSCYANRGVWGNVVPMLRPIITPSMGTIKPSLRVPVRNNLSSSEREMSIFFQIHALGYRTQEEERKILDIPSWA